MKSTEEAHLNDLLTMHFDSLARKELMSCSTIKEGARLLGMLFKIRSLAAHHKAVVKLLDTCINNMLEYLQAYCFLKGTFTHNNRFKPASEY